MFTIIFQETKDANPLGYIKDIQIVRKNNSALFQTYCVTTFAKIFQPENYFYVIMKRNHRRSDFIISAEESNGSDIDGVVYRKESEKGK